MLKTKIGLLILLVSLLLAACNPASSTIAALAPASQADPQEVLSPGLLSLEGTELALTPSQAALLLPLWQAYQSLSAAGSASQSEIQALYRQTMEALTSAQIEAIQSTTFTQEALSTLMQQYNIRSVQAADAQTGSSVDPLGPVVDPSGETGGAAPMAEMIPGSGPGGAAAPTDAASTTSNLNTLFAGALVKVLAQRVLA